MKNLLYTALGLMGLMGTLATGVVNASTYNIETQNPRWTYETITIYDPASPSVGFTIMDRNLGASVAGTGEDSYGYKYQWGNNYGFADSETITPVTDGIEWDESYNNSGYYSTNFINGNSHNYDVWSGNGHYDGLWGGSGDYDNGWDNGNPKSNRQGPCPVGYHVPSQKEWNDLLVLYASLYTGTITDEYTDEYGTYYEGDTFGEDFANYFKLPFAGSRNYLDASLGSQGSNGLYWSSSPNSASSNYARNLNLDSSNVGADYNSIRAYGGSVRCFKDSYVAPSISYTLELHANGGSVTTGTLETDNEGKVTLPTASREADENGERVFEGWFAGEGVSEKIGNSGDVITLTGDMDVYPHWAQTITIRDPTNPLSGFTIMDRNLGAENAGTDSSAYGFKYQWGNNYGFVNGCTSNRCTDSVTSSSVAVSATAGAIWNDVYNNHGYFGNTFIKSSSSSFGYDYWADNTRHNNLWGGGSDSADNGRGVTLNNPTDRQGPCPADYHVPSAGEWGLVVKYYRDTYATGVTLNGSNGLYYFSNADASSGFMSYFQIPFAGVRSYYDASLNNQGSNGYYWSSSPNSAGSNYARYLSLNSSSVLANDTSSRALGLSVRCFKDTYEAPTTYTLTFDSQGGDEVATGVAVKNTSRTRPENPSKSGYVFVDWYTTTGYESAFDFTGTLATGNLTVYAKWSKDCGTGVYFEEMDVCATKSVDNLVYYRTDEKGKDVISIKDPDSDTILTMLDKNEGATSNDITSTGSYGELYQRGNNAPIKNASTGAYSTSPAIYENYWPGHPYNVSTFIQGNVDYWQDNKHYANLWGGNGDAGTTTSVDTFRGGVKNGDVRQGPCGSGYHVPSMGEWNALITYWYNTKNPTSKKSLTSLNNFSDSVFKTDFKLPLAGNRGYYNASLYNQRSFGFYWSSSPDSASSYNARYLYLNSFNVNALDDDYRAYGLSVRCFKDSYVAPISYILEFDANGGELSGADSEGKLIQKVESGKKAQEPVGISKDGAVFQNWVYSGDEATAFDFSASVTSNTQLKAEWSTLYTLTIHYVNSKGVEVFPDYTGSYVSGAEYSVVSQTKEHYNVSPATVSGVMPNENHEETVTYSTQTEDTNDNGIADEDEDHFTLTIHYVNSKGGTVFEDYTGSYVSGASYNIASTAKEHYTIDKATISGVMGNADITETVTYNTETEDTNDNGIADEDEDHFTLTIHYVNSKGGTVFEDYTGSYVSGASYNIASTEKEHYTIDKATISGVMGNADVEETVTYSTETEDTNDNGIADEDEDHFTLTIHYVNSKGGEVFEDYTGSYVSGASYNVASTAKEHYTIDKATISGVMGNADITETVTYNTEIEDTNDNGIADEDEDHFTLTIHYVNSKGAIVFEDYTGSYVSGASYNIASTAKEHYTIDKATVSGVMPNENHEETVVYTPNNDKNNNGIADEDEPSSGGGSSGGGGSSKKPSDSGKTTEGGKGNNVDNDKNTENVIQSETKGSEESSNTPMDSSVDKSASEGQSYSPEFQEAYEFAKGKGITTMPTIQQAKIDGKLTRIAMAKMLSYYAINVLGQKPDETRNIKFKDVTDKMDKDYDDGVTLAYQLGIMGINMPNNKFRPNDEVPRAEFATALSRMLYSTPDGKPYYITHLAKLKAEGILKNDDYKMKELRGYVMIMLMRSAK